MFPLRFGASKLVGRSSAATAAAHRVAAARHASTLVVAEPTKDGAVSASTLSAITAAVQLDGGTGEIALLSLSDGSHPPVDVTSLPSEVQSILQAKLDGGNGALLAETVAGAVKAAVECGTFTHVVAASSKFGANFVPRAGALLGVSPVPDVVEILGEGASSFLIAFVYLIYVGLLVWDWIDLEIGCIIAKCIYLFIIAIVFTSNPFPIHIYLKPTTNESTQISTQTHSYGPFMPAMPWLRSRRPTHRSK